MTVRLYSFCTRMY